MRLTISAAIFSLATASPILTSIATVPRTANLENLAIRHIGDILVTSITSNAVHQVSPDGSYPPIAVATMLGHTSLLGITELERDVFYVAANNISGVSATPGSNAIWRLDMRDFVATTNGTITCPAKASRVVQVPDAGTLNGMTTLSATDILLADASAGTVNKFNVMTNDYGVFINDSSMAPLSTGLGIGVNGIHVRGEKLFYTSLDQEIFAAIPISGYNGSATGKTEVLASGIVEGDDFALSPDGRTAWVTSNGHNVLVEVDIVKKTSKIAANSTLLGHSSAAAFAGLNAEYKPSLYITGAQRLEGNTTIGHLVRVDL